VDFAYQGFGDGLAEDAVGLRELAKLNSELLVCSSFSKNFGLYGERVGALTLVAGTADEAQKALSQVRVSIRTNYSNPPTHGGAIVAAILGDAANYYIGKTVGPEVFTSSTSKLLNRAHLLRTQAFYDKYGGKTIIIARFIPIVRTFAPFVAGIGKMQYRRFVSFNVIGAVAWVALFIPAGYVFGNLEVVKKSFHLVIFAIIGLSILPAVIEFARERAKLQRAKAAS